MAVVMRFYGTSGLDWLRTRPGTKTSPGDDWQLLQALSIWFSLQTQQKSSYSWDSWSSHLSRNLRLFLHLATVFFSCLQTNGRLQFKSFANAFANDWALCINYDYAVIVPFAVTVVFLQVSHPVACLLRRNQRNLNLFRASNRHEIQRYLAETQQGQCKRPCSGAYPVPQPPKHDGPKVYCFSVSRGGAEMDPWHWSREPFLNGRYVIRRLAERTSTVGAVCSFLV